MTFCGYFSSGVKSHVYKEFCETQEIELNECLLSDLQLCQEDDPSMFCWLVPAVYNQFPKIVMGNEQCLHLVVSTVDGSQLQEIICLILQGEFDNLIKIVLGRYLKTVVYFV